MTQQCAAVQEANVPLPTRVEWFNPIAQYHR